MLGGRPQASAPPALGWLVRYPRPDSIFWSGPTGSGAQGDQTAILATAAPVMREGDVYVWSLRRNCEQEDVFEPCSGLCLHAQGYFLTF